MLERLAGNSTIAFDGILRATFPIPIDLLDQEKTTFHLPNGLLPTVACLLVYACTTRIPRFGAPRAIISDRGTHFCNDQFSKVMLKYGVTHRLSTAYHPQTSGQVEETDIQEKEQKESQKQTNPSTGRKGPSQKSSQLKKLQLEGLKLPNLKLYYKRYQVIQIVLWIVNSGCSKHMTGNLKLLRNFIEKFIGTVCFGNDNFAAITGYGDYVQGNLTICYVYYVEGLGHNLFLVGQFCDGDIKVVVVQTRILYGIWRVKIYLLVLVNLISTTSLFLKWRLHLQFV
ncbi:integrase, catalytic region, zinc finger, CCHC-type containing protein [Tanacetum coccineum]